MDFLFLRLPEDAFLMIDTLMEKLELLKAQEQIIAAKMRLLGVEYHPLDVSCFVFLKGNFETNSSCC